MMIFTSLEEIKLNLLLLLKVPCRRTSKRTSAIAYFLSSMSSVAEIISKAI